MLILGIVLTAAFILPLAITELRWRKWKRQFVERSKRRQAQTNVLFDGYEKLLHEMNEGKP